MTRPFNSDEWIVLSNFYDIAWDSSSFGELRSFSSGEPAMIPRLQAVVRSLVGLGCVEIRRRGKGDADEDLLDNSQALIEIDNRANWIGVDEPGFYAKGSFYVVSPTEDGRRTYEAELASGRAWDDGVLE